MTNQAAGIEAQVCADIADRQARGVAKYGTTVGENPLPLRAWLQHQYEELLDAAVYCRRAMAEIDGTTSGMDKRADFEAWAKSKNYAVTRYADGSYTHPSLNICWDLWRDLV